MEIVALVLLAAATVWGLLFARSGSLLVGGVLFLIVGYVFTHHFWSLHLGPISLTLARLLLVALVGLTAWRWRRGYLEHRPLTGADWLGMLFLGYLSMRFALTGEPGAIATSVSPTWRMIASFWMPAVLFCVVRSSEFNERVWKAFLTGLTLLGLYLALTGIAEVHEQWWAVFPRYIANPQLGIHFGRARGPALMSASLGLYLTACFWAAWFLWERVSRPVKVLLLAAMGLMVIATYYTYTRSTWIGLAGGLAFVPLLHLPRSWRPLFVCSMLVAGTVGILTVGGKLIDMGREDSNGSASHSVYQRESFLLVSMRMARDYPLWGCGFGRFYDCKLPYLSDRSQQIELESIRNLDHHNTLLSILTETGIVGFTLFAAMLAAWGRAAWQLARNSDADAWMRSQGLFSLAVLLTYLVNALLHDLTLSPSEQWLLCLTMGATIGLRSKLLVRTEAKLTLPGRNRDTASSLAPA